MATSGEHRVAEVVVIDWMACPVIERVPGRLSGVPVVRRSRVRPEDLLANLAQGADWLAENHDLPLADVDAVLAFYRDSQGVRAPAA